MIIKCRKAEVMSDTKKNSILIVDDAQFNIMSLTKILSPKYTLHVATNGIEAINAAKVFLPDVILLDILMKGMDGFEVITALKNTVETREIPVIFITALNSYEDEEKGLLLNAADYISKPFSPAIIELRVRNQMQIVNQINTIKRLIMFDALTDIPNRRSFNERLGIEWRRAVQNQTSIGILMMDLDKFKVYNDTYGHMQGDVLLQSAAKNFEHALRRASDFVARWGGEEFAALLPDADKNKTEEIAEKMRANIESMVVLCANGLETKTTVSIGANSIVPTVESSIDAFITQADTALYEAKEKGRNRVCTFWK